MIRKRKTLGLFTSLLLVSSIVTPTWSMAAERSHNPNPAILDVGSKLRADTLETVIAEGRLDLSGGSADASAGTSAAAEASAVVTPDDVGTVRNWVTNNDVTGQYVLTSFTLRGVGEYGEVWVANNLSFPAGDPRNSQVAITDTQVQYLLGEFDNRIYEKEVEFFAPPAERKGEHGALPYWEDEAGRVVILIDNIKDAGFYDSSYPSYIAGYFSPTISDLTDRNVMTIDSFDWLNRTGPDAARPYLYEGVFAHEFQHLLHSDTDGAEDTFVNEGLSDFAQYLVGYGHSDGHVDFFMNNLRNSLTIWGDQTDLQILGDYGIAYLFQLYLYEQYGEAFIQAEFRNPLHSITGVNDTLAQFGVDKTFDEVYADFMAAVLTNNFETIELSPNVEGSVESDNLVPAWGTDFKVITPSSKVDQLNFEGIDFLGTNWTNAEDEEKGAVVWGNTADLADNFLIKSLDLTGLATAEISFDTKYNIEEEWDFGVVQVSTDGGQTWTSLANENTRDDLVADGHPKIAANLPGFTGSSDGWVTETFDLSAYAGQEVLLGFRYLTDWGFTESGWYLSDLQLNGETIDPMTSTDGFMSLEEAKGEYVNYQLQFIGFKKGYAAGKTKELKVIQVNDLLTMSDSDQIDLRNMIHGNQFEKIIMMTTFVAPEGTNANATYDYEVVEKTKSNKKK